MIYGNDELLEYVDQLVVVPRICEHCLGHDAVYYCCAQWPSTYVCAWCLDSPWWQLRQDLGAQEKSPLQRGGFPNRPEPA